MPPPGGANAPRARALPRGRTSDRVSRGQFVRFVAAVLLRNAEHGPELRKAAKRGETGCGAQRQTGHALIPSLPPAPACSAVLEFVRRGCSPNGADGTGRTALHEAAEFGRDETLAALRGLCGDELAINAADADGWYVVRAQRRRRRGLLSSLTRARSPAVGQDAALGGRGGGTHRCGGVAA